MTINEIIKLSGGRRLEFKEILPENADLANTIIAFANDAGGELYVGIRNNPREIVGLYTVSHWEYPIKAIREAIRNAIVHRDYSLSGKDVRWLSSKLIEDKLIENTITENKNHPKQKLRITKRGIVFLESLKK